MGDNTGRPLLAAVVALTADGVIGKEGDMPWRLRRDLRRFKKITMGGVLIMGRKTFDSIPDPRPLPGRRTIVLTRNSDWQFDGVDTAASVEQVFGKIGNSRAYVVGGAQIYEMFLKYCDQLFVTRVWSQVAGDTQMRLDLSEMKILRQSRYPAGKADQVPTEFFHFAREKP